DHDLELFRLDEEQAAVIVFGDLVGVAARPGFAHECGAVEHAAVEEHLDGPDADPFVADARRPAAAVLAGEFLEAASNLVAGAASAEAAGDVYSHGQFAGLVQAEVKIEVAAAGVAIGDAGQAALVVEAEQFLHGLAAFLGRDARVAAG